MYCYGFICVHPTSLLLLWLLGILCRWHLVVHRAVDGYSRIPVYLFCSQCSDNNKAKTILSLFLKAVSVYGLLECVVTRGRKCWCCKVSSFTSSLWARLRDSHSRKKHSQSTYRKDMARHLSRSPFLCLRTFCHLELISLLDPDNDFDIFCLHYVFVPWINYAVAYWKNAWVKNPICSQHN